MVKTCLGISFFFSGEVGVMSCERVYRCIGLSHGIKQEIMLFNSSVSGTEMMLE